MKGHRAAHGIATMCRVLGVSTSGYYAWQQREPSQRARLNETLLERIRTIHVKSRETYGAPRVHAELRDEGVVVSYNRVARLMRAARLQGASRRKGCWTTQVAPTPTSTTRSTSRASAAAAEAAPGV